MKMEINGKPNNYAATVNGEAQTTRALYSAIIEAQKYLSQQQRGRRNSSSAYRAIETQINTLANARYFDTLQNPSGTREEIYAKAAQVLENLYGTL